MTTIPWSTPGAEERCGDGLDNDCDGRIDDIGLGAITLFRDSDGDGFGTEETTAACESQIMNGWSREPDDCDDADASIHPGAEEICDDVDQDCDGVVDDGLVFRNYHADDDLDGFGDTHTPPVTSCVPVEGRVPNDQDCDDSNRTIFPGAAELCDGVDNDCDGPIDESVASIGELAYPDLESAFGAASLMVNPSIDVCPGEHSVPSGETRFEHGVELVGQGPSTSVLRFGVSEELIVEGAGEG